MQKVPPTDNQTPSPPPDGSDEPKNWKRAADGIWLRIPSGFYYERPTINGAATYRSLFTKNLDEALKEYYRPHAKGDAAYQKASATTVGEVILNYEAVKKLRKRSVNSLAISAFRWPSTTPGQGSR